MKLSNIRQDAADGAVGSFYTQDWGCRIYPWLNIDKVKFSFFQLGDKPDKKSFDIYVDILTFYIWVKDIHNGKLFAIIDVESKSSQYPVLYKDISGNNGEKNVGFCKGRQQGFYCINGKDGEDYCLIPIHATDLRAMALKFTVATRTYFSSLFDDIEKRINDKVAENSQYFVDKPAAESKPTTTQQNHQTGTIQEYNLTTLGGMSQFTIAGETNSPCFKLMARTSDGGEVEVQFLSSFIKKSLGIFNQFAEYLQEHPVGTPLKIMAKPYEFNGKPQLQFQNFVREVS